LKNPVEAEPSVRFEEGKYLGVFYTDGVTEAINGEMLIPFVHRFLFFLECGGLPPLSKAKPRLRTPNKETAINRLTPDYFHSAL
jgi:hypothetical protein